MIYLETHSLDPTWNLAFEEYCMQELAQFDKIMLLWQNKNAIILGRYQNAEREVNIDVAQQIGARIVRRPSGGGTVYHDLGNLNYSFIHSIGEGLKNIDFASYAQPMANALNKLGIPAELKGRNDLLLHGKKISGTAQRIRKGRLLHHGTLLFDSNLGTLESVLRVDADKITSKGIASVRSRVTNIKEYLPKGQMDTLQAFWDALLGAFAKEEPLTPYQLSEPMLAEVKALQESKYQSWDWNFGRAPAFEYSNSKRFPGGKVEIQVNVAKGYIQACQVSGDFMGMMDLEELETALQNVKYDAVDVRRRLQQFDLPLYLGSVTLDEFVECMFEGMLRK